MSKALGRCAVHPDRSAEAACERCGNFVCRSCLDPKPCITCFKRKPPRAWVFSMLRVVFFVAIFALLNAMLILIPLAPSPAQLLSFEAALGIAIMSGLYFITGGATIYFHIKLTSFFSLRSAPALSLPCIAIAALNFGGVYAVSVQWLDGTAPHYFGLSLSAAMIGAAFLCSLILTAKGVRRIAWSCKKLAAIVSAACLGAALCALLLLLFAVYSGSIQYTPLIDRALFIVFVMGLQHAALNLAFFEPCAGLLCKDLKSS